MDNYKDLNPEQKQAVEKIKGPLLVLAGAGSGKTRVVTYRIAHILKQGVAPHEILGVTFTNKAAGEMKERVRALTNSNVLVCTFHSLGARILRESIHHLGYVKDFTVYDEDDVDRLLKVCLNDLFADQKFEVKQIRQLISQAKNDLLAPVDVMPSLTSTNERRVFPAIYARYQERLLASNAVDFDDLLFLTVRLFREHPDILNYYQERWHYLHIDEYQDTNATQYAIVQHLVAKSKNLCVVGDPDQSIYSWRGANINNILNFEHDFPGASVVHLERNYRSHTNILNAANELISRNEERYKKNLWSDLGPGEKIKHYVCQNEKVEAAYVVDRILHHHRYQQTPLNQMVIFYRTNAQSRVFEDYLLQKRLSYVIVGGISFYQRREVKDILAFLRIVHSGVDMISFLRTVNIPKRGLGDTTIEKLQNGADQENMPLFLYCQALVQGRPLENRVSLSAKQKAGLTDYINIIVDLQSVVKEGVGILVEETIKRTGYLNYLKEDPTTYDDRVGNLDALVSKAVDWEESAEEPLLSLFLEELSLKSTLDETAGTEERVNLMTLHNGKGLEFDVTFLVGMEEDLFPHVNSRDSKEELEEERRLCYVGMTRAKKYLYLTHCLVRSIWGKTRNQRPSRFLREIPLQYLEKVNGKRVDRGFYDDDGDGDEDEDDDDGVYEKEKVVVSYVEEAKPFAVGETVYHPEFGIGAIREIYEADLGLMYRIFFTKFNSVKTLVAKMAKIRRL